MRQTEGQTDRHSDTPTDRHNDKHTQRHPDRHPDRQTDRPTDPPNNTHPDTQINVRSGLIHKKTPTLYNQLKDKKTNNQISCSSNMESKYCGRLSVSNYGIIYIHNLWSCVTSHCIIRSEWNKMATVFKREVIVSRTEYEHHKGRYFPNSYRQYIFFYS